MLLVRSAKMAQLSCVFAGLYVLLCRSGAVKYLPDFVDPVSSNL